MDLFKEKTTPFTGVLNQFEHEKGPFFGNKGISPLFPGLLTEWSRVAILAVVTMTVFLLIYQVVSSFLNKQDLEARLGSSTATLNSLQTEPLKPFLHYVSNLKKREIFKIYQAPGRKVVPTLPQLDIKQATAHLILSGIIFEEEPQAIIEDKKKKKTYILKKGDYLENIKIDSINRGKVRLRLDSQTIDLEL